MSYVKPTVVLSKEKEKMEEREREKMEVDEEIDRIESIEEGKKRMCE